MATTYKEALLECAEERNDALRELRAAESRCKGLTQALRDAQEHFEEEARHCGQFGSLAFTHAAQYIREARTALGKGAGE